VYCIANGLEIKEIFSEQGAEKARQGMVRREEKTE
jgi:hypothetical protein